ncbi:MAG: hypothetical protein AAF845_16930 [Bacteroidota bacterium]
MRVLSVLALAFVLTACDAFGGGDGIRVDLEPGLRLEYAVTETKDHADGARTEAAWTSTAAVVATDATVYDEHGLTELLLTSTGLEGGGRVWYRTSDNALAEVAYAGGAGGSALRTVSLGESPALPRPVRRLVADRAASQARLGADDDPVLRGEPRVVLDYDAAAGQDWVHYDFSFIGFPLTSYRRLEGEATIDTEAGTFRCLVVRSTVEFAGADQGVDWVDHIADVGLVRREVIVRDPETDDDGAETGRTTVTTLRQEVTAVVR